jgi:hypothetical protein
MARAVLSARGRASTPAIARAAQIAGPAVSASGSAADEDPEGQQPAGEHGRREVHGARQQPHRDPAPHDDLRCDASARQRPDRHGESPGAAGWQQHVRALHRDRDVVAQPPGHAPAEDRAKRHDERHAGGDLQRQHERQPAGRGSRQPVAYLAKPRQRGDGEPKRREHEGDQRHA